MAVRAQPKVRKKATIINFISPSAVEGHYNQYITRTSTLLIKTRMLSEAVIPKF